MFKMFMHESVMMVAALSISFIECHLYMPCYHSLGRREACSSRVQAVETPNLDDGGHWTRWIPDSVSVLWLPW